jgi:hypothetical protein
MNHRSQANTPVRGGHVSHDSPKVHAAGVKHEIAEKCLYIGIKKNSLSSFTRSPPPPPARVYARAHVTGGETRETRPLFVPHPLAARCDGWPTSPASRALRFVRSPFAPTPQWATSWRTARLPKWHGQRPLASRPIGTSRQAWQGEARGNSRQVRESLFSLSERPPGEIPCPNRLAPSATASGFGKTLSSRPLVAWKASFGTSSGSP